MQNQTGEPNKRISNDEVKAQVERYIGKYLFDYCISAEGMTHYELMREENSIGNMRTLAFQVPEELFQQIKDYLQHNNMTQKEFVIGLIKTEIDRDLTQRAEAVEALQEIEEAAKYSDEQDNSAIYDGFEEVSYESEDIDEEQEESEYMGMGMSM